MIAAGLMLCGFSLLAMTTAAVSSLFVREDIARKRRVSRRSRSRSWKSCVLFAHGSTISREASVDRLRQGPYLGHTVRHL